jgi:hypothetical protein
MALSAGTIYEVRSTATAGNVNGGGFNPANPNGLTNLTTTTGTGNTASPVVSSASYNFAAGDVGAWLYIQGGTNWTPGWYQIASVASNKATLSAGVGQAIQVSNNRFQTNTVAGCATTGTPTGGTFMIDYCQQNAAQVSFTNLKSTSGSTTLTDNSSGNKFTKVMVGNLINITSGTNFTPGWYEIISFTNANNVVLDSSPHGANTATGGHGKVGGAISLGASGTSGDLAFSESLPLSTSAVPTIVFVQGNSSYTLGESISAEATFEGYDTVRGDRPKGTTRPTIAMGLYGAFTAGDIRNLIITSDSTCLNAGLVSLGAFTNCVDTKLVNGCTIAGAVALTAGNSIVSGCEVVCYRGIGAYVSNVVMVGNYVHDCDVGVTGATSLNCTNNIICCCVTAAINFTYPPYAAYIANNTLYGAQNNLAVGISFPSSSSDNCVMNNIITGFVTGVSAVDTSTLLYSDYNDYYNNTSDVSSEAVWQKGANDLAVDPQFANVAQLTGSTATTSGSVLTQSGADFSSVVDGRDYLYLVSGTGVTDGIYGITAHTTTTLTLDIAPGTDATADKVWQITTGRDFGIGTNLAGQGVPGVFPGGTTTSYVDIGGAQIELADSFTFGG